MFHEIDLLAIYESMMEVINHSRQAYTFVYFIKRCTSYRVLITIFGGEQCRRWFYLAIGRFYAMAGACNCVDRYRWQALF